MLSKHRPKASWPAKGAVEFKNYSTRYRQGLDLVLKNINLSFEAHEKIGVVGRTGAGKSSLTLALFRLIEPAAGHIAIDDLNTSSIGLLDVRRRLAIIPQDAALFEGTVRDNLDPGHVHDDTELWSVLCKFKICLHHQVFRFCLMSCLALAKIFGGALSLTEALPGVSLAISILFVEANLRHCN